MTKSSKTAVVDSSALIALLNVTDADHDKASQLQRDMEAAAYSIVLLMEVLAESLNVIGRKVGRLAAVEAGRVLFEEAHTNHIVLSCGDLPTLSQALDFQAVASGGPSFVDCLVMAQADREGTSYIFGFDATFKKNGYRLPD